MFVFQLLPNDCRTVRVAGLQPVVQLLQPDQERPGKDPASLPGRLHSTQRHVAVSGGAAGHLMLSARRSNLGPNKTGPQNKGIHIGLTAPSISPELAPRMNHTEKPFPDAIHS
jgi:hypothetical protein